MLLYPQLASGALGQFPIVKRRRFRTIFNIAADGSWIKLGDPGAGGTEWQLKYRGLADIELAALQQFFLAAEGSLNSFTFVDPTANLLAWSGDLTNAAWTIDPQLAVTSSENAWHLNNRAAGPQSLSQTLNAPGDYLYCFSAFVRAAQPGTVTLTAGTAVKQFPVGADTTRVAASGTGIPGASSVGFCLTVPADGAVDVFGLQVEAQGAPSAYQVSTTGGVYQNARLRDDVLSFTTYGVNRHSAQVNVLYANHL